MGDMNASFLFQWLGKVNVKGWQNGCNAESDATKTGTFNFFIFFFFLFSFILN